ncbi:hypothetical protein BAU15_10325 [Enterococcus sp. JM4C]|uniref:DUF6440 family protein n=1 Tax=Candidatus Enterococcus huntleyi TaxID=1857217 RepID=UPI00137AAB02|nr:DUF6440 family protein [Enterococcus sp. JM4C]KAF1296176.1 hypothetical protein BAU15_10325 [Enterococcus sp. JM4C]
MENRFTVTKEKCDKGTVVVRTVTDQTTGVQYLYTYDSVYGASGLTPLLNADGKPLINKA